MIAYFALSVFLSAFLLFQIEPMIGKIIMPGFGGMSAVWSAILMFFQIFFAGGYAYASWLTGARQDRKRIRVYMALLGASILIMLVFGWLRGSPVFLRPGEQPISTGFPILDILILLGTAIGLPYFLLSANSTLMQTWFLRLNPGRAPYFLYALSNAGSILGLVGYLLLMEPKLPLPEQGLVWSGGYLVFTLLAGYGALRSLKADPVPEPNTGSETRPKPRAGIRIVWMALSACTSILLLATTAHLTQEVAVIPFLWVLPLCLYLLAFIIAFSGVCWFSRGLSLLLLVTASILFRYALALGAILGLVIQIVLLAVVLFLVCLVFNVELYRLRPPAEHLASFYLSIATGGAAGAAFVVLLAPVIFAGYWELPLGMVVSWVLFGVILLSKKLRAASTGNHFLQTSLLIFGVILTSSVAYHYIQADRSNAVLVERNFYGVVRVKQVTGSGPGLDAVQMTHGSTVHGIQFTAEGLRDQPTTYYTENSGAGLAILHHPRRGQGMRVGVLGLGAGTLAAYSQPKDSYRFYEINPAVIELAEGRGGYFSFLQNSPAAVQVVEGDARLSLERELSEGTHQKFDVLILDTFNSDSIPVHLMNEQAFQVYLQHLSPDGVLAIHISNRHFDFVPVIWQLAGHFNLHLKLIENAGNEIGSLPSEWVLLSPDSAVLDNSQIAEQAVDLGAYTTSLPLWTDIYSNPMAILK